METKVYFENIEKILLEELSKAQFSIKLVVAWLTNKKLFAKLVELAEKGIIVNVIINDDEINKDSFLDYSRLNIGKSFLKVTETKNGNILHHKFCIIDDNTVINGSYNWTYKANYNNENIHLNTNKNLAKQHSVEFINILSKANDYNRISYQDEDLLSSNNISDKEKKKFYENEELSHKQEKEKFITWKHNQGTYEVSFIEYLSKLSIELNLYSKHYCNNSVELESKIGHIINFYSIDFHKKNNACIFKYLIMILFKVFKENMDNYNNFTISDSNFYSYWDKGYYYIMPHFHSKTKELIYQNKFQKSMCGFQFKATLLLIMLDYAYEDLSYNGLLFSEDEFVNDYIRDYRSDPKIYHSDISENILFLKNLKEESLLSQYSEYGRINICNSIRYFSEGMKKFYSEDENFDFTINALNNKEFNTEISDSEIEYCDIIIKMHVNKFHKILKEVKDVDSLISFELAKTVTEVNMNIENLDFITNEVELKLLIQNFVEQKVIIKDVIYNENENSYKVNTLQWSFDKSKDEIKKEILMIHHLNQYIDFESKFDVWTKLESEHMQKLDYNSYLQSYKLLEYLKNNKIELNDFINEDKKYQDAIREIASKCIDIPNDIPNAFNVIQLINSLKVNTASMPIRKDIIIPKEIKKGKVLDELFKNEFNGERTNIQINEQVKPFIWLENGENIRVNKNAKKCKNTGQFLLFGKDYIFRQSSLVLGNPQNVLVKADSKTDEMPKYDEIEKENQIKYNSNLPFES